MNQTTTIPQNPVMKAFYDLHVKYVSGATPRPANRDIVANFRAIAGLDTKIEEFCYYGKDYEDVQKAISEYIPDFMSDKVTRTIRRESQFYCIDDETIVLMASVDSYERSPVTVVLSGDPTFVDELLGNLKEKFYCSTIEIIDVHVDGDYIRCPSTTIEIHDKKEIAPFQHYPYLKHCAEDLTAEFNNSKNNLIVLIGPPGTGKSTYLRSMAFAFSEMKRKVYVIGRDNVVRHPNFETWVSRRPENSVIIIEDADNLVGRRSEGNDVMSMLLNQLDGIVPSNRKFIISTNLSSIKKVDEALIRPGRCFDILNFRSLSPEEAKGVYAHRYPDHQEIPEFPAGGISLAEVLNYDSGAEQSRRKSGFGFITND